MLQMKRFFLCIVHRIEEVKKNKEQFYIKLNAEIMKIFGECIIMKGFNGKWETQWMALEEFIVVLIVINETEKVRRF